MWSERGLKEKPPWVTTRSWMPFPRRSAFATWTSGGVADRASKLAIAPAQRNLNRVSADGKVELAIPVELANSYATRMPSGGECSSGFERAIALSEQNADVVTPLIWHDQVALSVPIQVANYDGGGIRAYLVCDWSPEAAVAFAQIDTGRHWRWLGPNRAAHPR
jgi:hypothetical protein